MKVTFEFNLKTALRWVVGLLLIWAAISKLANLQDFYGSLLTYELPLPDFFLRFAAMFLPWLELLCGLMLLIQYRTEVALTWAIVLFAIFVLATGQAWARGLEITCGCFNLKLLGLDENDSVVKILHSVTFAFFRALLLMAAGVFLWRELLKNPPPAGMAEALRG